ncbi:MAG: hypothetical protein E6X67_03190, partial [Neisseria subflava]|nr:hypothetical protein [Neisseria subflava]
MSEKWFTQTFAVAGKTKPWDENQYSDGWGSIGNRPPTKEQFNWVLRRLDEKINFIYRRNNSVELNKELVKKVHIVKNINELRQFSGDGVVFVCGYHETGAGYGDGLFIADSLDKSSADNSVSVIVGVDNLRWKRVFDGAMSLYDFGYLPSKNNAKEAVNTAESAALGVFVDCLGLTVDIGTKYPTKNKYTNGKFTISGKTVDMQYQPIRSGIGRFITGSGAAANLKSSEWAGTGLVVIGEGAMAKMEKCVSGIAIGDRAQGFSKISRDNIAIGPDSLISVQAETEWYDQSKMAGTRNI